MFNCGSRGPGFESLMGQFDMSVRVVGHVEGKRARVTYSLDRYGEIADSDNCGGMLSTRYQPPKVEKTRAGSRAIQ
ncbi:jg25032 [Pararge aegeria aegeria]|uniref:Jg25032 protein n=1 Tax=Pararge aegeria aegeria TaxID=348720 RepID=A0A8S4R5R2_9NEOP|nr:jg25032 [Pararge aegeria aegeria]